MVPATWEAIGRRIMVETRPSKSEILPEKAKNPEVWLKW
jgi:hypothetical protein